MPSPSAALRICLALAVTLLLTACGSAPDGKNTFKTKPPFQVGERFNLRILHDHTTPGDESKHTRDSYLVEVQVLDIGAEQHLFQWTLRHAGAPDADKGVPGRMGPFLGELYTDLPIQVGVSNTGTRYSFRHSDSQESVVAERYVDLLHKDEYRWLRDAATESDEVKHYVFQSMKSPRMFRWIVHTSLGLCLSLPPGTTISRTAPLGYKTEVPWGAGGIPATAKVRLLTSDVNAGAVVLEWTRDVDEAAATASLRELARGMVHPLIADQVFVRMHDEVQFTIDIATGRTQKATFHRATVIPNCLNVEDVTVVREALPAATAPAP